MSSCRCLIVDDEDLILERLEHFFMKHQDEFELVGKAYSGTEGLQLAEETRPEIVITDIVMPEMDGIEMIEQLQQRVPGIYGIILSAYSEFAYAQKAMQLKVGDYIVKVPLDEQALLQALRKGASALKEQKKQTDEMTRLDQTKRKNVHRVRKQVFAELMRGEWPARSIRSWEHEMMLDLDMDSYCACRIQLGDCGAFLQRFSKADQRALRYGLLNMAEECLQSRGRGFLFEHSEAAWAGYISWPHMHSQSEQMQRAYELGTAIIEHAQHYLKLRVSVAFSGVFRSLDGLQPAYKHADEVMELFYYTDKPAVVLLPHQLQLHEPGLPEAEGELRKQLHTLLGRVRAGLPCQTFEDALAPLAARIRQLRIRPARATSLLREAAAELSAWSPVAAAHLERPIWQIDTFAWLRLEEQLQLLLELVREMTARGGTSDRPEVQAAKAFISSHVHERLTLQQVADHVGLSPNYFSAMFKREEQLGLVDYINRKKIELAQQLLLERSFSNFELSERIGIGNERYFCTLFRQYTGSSPQQYRKQLKR